MIRTLITISLILFSLSFESRIAAKKSPQTAKKSAQNPNTGKFKAIWEPINYKEDVKFTDVLFINDKVGWVTGSVEFSKGGVILHTRDGGENWTIQLGDLQSSERAYTHLRAVNDTTIFAAQGDDTGDHNLLRTTDGENWEVCGNLPEHRGDYTFISPTVGFISPHQEIRRTQDAGRTWKRVLACESQIEIQGLMRNVKCGIDSFHFPSDRVGYALGYSYDATAVYVARTEDGGASWNVWPVLPGETGREGDVFFTDENTGFIRVQSGKFFATSDGGKTWRGLTGTDGNGRPEIKFADREVGWSVSPYGPFNYTFDGGRRWAVRQIKFPTNPSAFSLPSRNRGYVVGEHGMIFRYRIVPVDYTVRGIIDAPMMGGGEPAAR
jgi:photosystem II stability/assembly factor-like uncharacterized protein